MPTPAESGPSPKSVHPLPVSQRPTMIRPGESAPSVPDRHFCPTSLLNLTSLDSVASPSYEPSFTRLDLERPERPANSAGVRDPSADCGPSRLCSTRAKQRPSSSR